MVGSRPAWTTQQDPALPSSTHRKKNKKTTLILESTVLHMLSQQLQSLVLTIERFSTYLPHSLTFIWTLFQSWSQKPYSSVITCSGKTVIYEDPNFYYLVKIKFCEITSFSVSFGQRPPSTRDIPCILPCEIPVIHIPLPCRAWITKAKDSSETGSSSTSEAPLLDVTGLKAQELIPS